MDSVIDACAIAATAPFAAALPQRSGVNYKKFRIKESVNGLDICVASLIMTMGLGVFCLLLTDYLAAQLNHVRT